MATAQIKSTVLSSTIIGSRDDVSVGNTVSLEHNGTATTYLWQFISKPPGSSTTFSPSASSSNPSFVPDIIGSYLIKLTVDGDSANSDSRIIAVKSANLSFRIPASGETNEFDKNTLSGVDGWHEAMYVGIKAIDDLAGLTLKTDGSNSPSADIDWDNNKITNLGAPTAGTDAARDQDIPSTLSELNSRLSTTIDESTDTRTPITHSLGSSFHTAITLSELNTLISDATLDDYGDSRTADLHALAGALHSASSLVELNALISDATLDDFSNSRPAIAHGLASSTHFSADLSSLNGKLTDANLADESDISLDFTYNRGRQITMDLGPIILDGYSDEQTLILTHGSMDINDGYLKIGSVNTNPNFEDGYGSIFSKSNGGYSELFYIDDYGNVIQITKSGYINDGYINGDKIGIDWVPTNYTPSLLPTEVDSVDQLTAHLAGIDAYFATLIGNNSLDGAYNFGRTILADSGPVYINAAGGDALELEGYLILNETTGISPLNNSGILYSKEIDGYSELNYMDAYGNDVQMTFKGSNTSGFTGTITLPNNYYATVVNGVITNEQWNRIKPIIK